ncbi:hypothetical protein B0H17DRAFT_1199227 [Mycena rosella]|uniref:Uncharacterized protein n=1 Tax=Mycena rosella TaxID=1033263 RepID=A0AAD7DNF1_MYCRO|nr:hypothetical protein B0H17DRAFT_1199227 [Mycena rosella]
MLTGIADGSLLPNVEMLIGYTAEPATLISTLQTRQNSIHHSTIREVGLASYDWLTADEMAALAKLMSLGVFLSECNQHDRLPVRGELHWDPLE